MAELPTWQPLQGVIPPVQAGGAGRLIALVATEGAVSSGWAPTAAMTLARSWSAQGHKIVLVDGALNGPSLHDVAGIPNREGLTDATLHGASVNRVSHPLDGGVFLITAGTPVANSHDVLRSPRWFRLTSGFTDAGVNLLLYLPDLDPGTTGFLGSASDIVVLSDDGERAPSAVTDLEPLVRAVTGMGGDFDRASGAVAAPPATAAAARKVDKPSGGTAKVLLFIVLVIVIAGLLGYVLTSGLG